MEQSEIKLFEGQNIRYVWDDEKEQYFFSVVDVIQVLTESPRPRKYWNALKTKLQAEGSEVSQNMGQLKLPATDGKWRLTDVATTEQLFRLIQSIPSKKAEPFKLWLAEVGRGAGFSRRTTAEMHPMTLASSGTPRAKQTAGVNYPF